jgi:GTP-binding protein Era
MSETPHKAGFVSIIGKPNVGKSTLMNALTGEKLSIVTSKAQTTRHRIMGIVNGEDFQIVYSDTPGILEPQYELHRSMMKFVSFALEDADVILFITDIYEEYEENQMMKRLHKTNVPIFLLLNKIDQADEMKVNEKLNYWKEKIKAEDYIPVSALEKFNLEKIFGVILQHLPVHPPYFDKDEMTDKPERFFAAEILREKIFLNYKKEIPYSTEVSISEFKEKDDIIAIRAEIYVERDSQKGILIGHKGEMLKKIGMEARKDMEQFFGKKVFLETHVKVEPDWRNKMNKLKSFGYNIE